MRKCAGWEIRRRGEKVAENKRTIDAKSKLLIIGGKQSKKVSFIITDKEGKDEKHLSCEEMIEGMKKKFRKEIRALREDFSSGKEEKEGKKIRSLEKKIITAEKLVIELRKELRREEEKRRGDARKRK